VGVKIFLYCVISNCSLFEGVGCMPIRKKIVKKKRKNEAKEALAKASGGEELEIAAKILGELRERNKRKKILEKKG
jgi:hypothetical protein